VAGEVAPQVAVGLGAQFAGRGGVGFGDDRHRVPQLYCCLTSLR
jgi:hypothetical protein